jgi:uncharacterized protein with ATP-grasp and redox domains
VEVYPYCKICGAKGRETHTHSTTDHEEEPALWSLVAALTTWTYRRRKAGDITRDSVLREVYEYFKEVREDGAAEDQGEE